MHTRIIFHTTWAAERMDDEYLEDFYFSDVYSEDFFDTEVILGYKFSAFTPLHLVSKQVSKEVQEEADITNSRLHDLLLFNTAVDNLFCDVAEDSFFLELCSRSRLEINAPAEDVMDFVFRIPKPLRDRVPSIVLRPSALLIDDEGTDLAWQWGKYIYNTNEWEWNHSDEMDDWNGSKSRSISEHSIFVKSLCMGFAALREIAIWLPELDYPEPGDYAYSAPNEMGQLLREGYVDIVRFLYRESNPNLRVECSWLKMTLSPDKSLSIKELRNDPLVVTVEEPFDVETGQPPKQTTESPFNVLPEAKTVIALRRQSS